MQKEISRKNNFVFPSGISEAIQSYSNIQFKGNLKAYYKVRQLSLLQSATAILLQSATSASTKLDDYYKVQ